MGAAASRNLGQAQHGADAVGELVIGAGQDAIERGWAASRHRRGPEQKAELGGGEQVGGVVLGDEDAEFFRPRRSRFMRSSR